MLPERIIRTKSIGDYAEALRGNRGLHASAVRLLFAGQLKAIGRCVAAFRDFGYNRLRTRRAAYPPLTGPRQFDIMQSGPGWQGTHNAIRSIEMAREGGT